MNALATILVKLAVGVLAYYQGRADFRDMVLLEAKHAGLTLALEAEKYKADARLSGTQQSFGVRGGAKSKRVQAKDSGSHD